MSELPAQIRLRPARIALLVRPTDEVSVRRFMCICACMWGGILNPIVPVFRAAPHHWRPEDWDRVRGYNVAKGYVGFFEPDAYVEAQEGLLEKVGLAALRDSHRANRRVFALDELLVCRNQNKHAGLSLGLSVVDSLRQIYDEEQRFVLRRERSGKLVKAERDSAIAETTFGVYPTEPTTRYISEIFEKVYRADTLSASPELWRAVFLEGATTPLSATLHGVSTRWLRKDSLVVFFYDPTQVTDLIDLWNLRIESSPILPVPICWFSKLTSELSEIIIEETNFIKDDSLNVKRPATLEFARSINREIMEDTVQGMKSALSVRAKDSMKVSAYLSIKSWRNQIWVPQSDDSFPQHSRREVAAAECRVNLRAKRGRRMYIEFDSLAPGFAERHGDNNLRWVNVVRHSSWGASDVTTVFPFNTRDPRWPRLSLGVGPESINSEGWCFGERLKDSTKLINVYTNYDAVVGWLKQIGVEARQSEPGIVAKEILEHIGGPRGSGLLADIQTLKLLNEMAGGIRTRRVGDKETEQLFSRRSKPTKVWQDLVSRRNQQHDSHSTSVKRFTESNILRLGIETSCTHCQAFNWHGLDQASYELKCERCLKSYDFPEASLRPQNRNWAYRVVGPFAVPDYARGSYTVVLTLGALEYLISSMDPMTYSTALELKFDGLTLEVDFLVWHTTDSTFESRAPEIIVGEAKSIGDGELLKREDITKLKKVGERIPGSMIAISVLREQFTESEKRLLRGLVRWGRRLNDQGGPTNPILLLTQTELLGQAPIDYVWEKKGGVHKKHAEGATRNLRSFADATVALNLGLPWFAQQRYEFRRRRREMAKASGDA